MARPLPGGPGWQSWSGGELPKQTMLQLRGHSSGHCLVEKGQGLPSPVAAEVLAKAAAVARGFGCQLPVLSYPVRIPTARALSPAGFVRSVLLGVEGQLPHTQGLSVAQLCLEEGPCTPTRGLDALGEPWLALWSHWSAPLPSLPYAARRVQEALASSGLVLLAGATFVLEFKATTRVASIEGIARAHHLPAMLQRAQSQDSYTAPGFVEVFQAESDGGSLVFKGWRKRQPHPLDPEATPCSIAQLEANPAILRWGWREKWSALGLSGDVLDGLLREGKVALFEDIVQFNPKIHPKIWGELLVRWPRSLGRKGLPIEALAEERYLALASLHGMGRCHREALCELLRHALLYPDLSVQACLSEKLGVSPLSLKKLVALLPQLVEEIPEPRATGWQARERYWMGQVMGCLRGAVPGYLVRRELYRLFSTAPPSPQDQCPFPPPDDKKRKRRQKL